MGHATVAAVVLLVITVILILVSHRFRERLSEAY
jgi:membrane protein implicated in regulation of membrane protease activity